MNIAALGLVADISVLSQLELDSTGFWKAEGVVELEHLVASCRDAT